MPGREGGGTGGPLHRPAILPPCPYRVWTATVVEHHRDWCRNPFCTGGYWFRACGSRILHPPVQTSHSRKPAAFCKHTDSYFAGNRCSYVTIQITRGSLSLADGLLLLAIAVRVFIHSMISLLNPSIVQATNIHLSIIAYSSVATPNIPVSTFSGTSLLYRLHFCLLYHCFMTRAFLLA